MTKQKVQAPAAAEAAHADSPGDDLLSVVAATQMRGETMPGKASIAVGTVVSKRDGYTVDCAEGLLHTRRSTGCLLAVEEGDIVLVVSTGSKVEAEDPIDGYILQVLERKGGEQAGAVLLEPDCERLSIRAPVVEVSAGSRLNLTAPTLSAVTERLTLLAGASMSFLGNLLDPFLQDDPVVDGP